MSTDWLIGGEALIKPWEFDTSKRKPLVDNRKVSVTPTFRWINDVVSREIITYERHELIIDEYESYDPYRHTSLLRGVEDIYELYLRMRQYNKDIFKHGFLGEHILMSFNHPLTDADREKYEAEAEAKFSGQKRVGKPILIDGQQVSISSLGMNNQELEYSVGKQQLIVEIAQLLGVPSELLDDRQASTYNNVRQAHVGFYSETIAEELKLLAESLYNQLPIILNGDMSLLPANTKYDDLQLRFDYSKIQGSTQNIIDLSPALVSLQSARNITINEARRYLGLEPLDDPEANEIPKQLFPSLGGFPQSDDKDEDDTEEPDKEDDDKTKTQSRQIGYTWNFDQYHSLLDASSDRFHRWFVGAVNREVENVKRHVSEQSKLGDGQQFITLENVIDIESIYRRLFSGGLSQMVTTLSAAGIQQATVFDLVVPDFNTDIYAQGFLNRRIEWWARYESQEVAHLMQKRTQRGGG